MPPFKRETFTEKLEALVVPAFKTQQEKDPLNGELLAQKIEIVALVRAAIADVGAYTKDPDVFESLRFILNEGPRIYRDQLAQDKDNFVGGVADTAVRSFFDTLNAQVKPDVEKVAQRKKA